MAGTASAPARIDIKISPQDASWDDIAATCRAADESGAFDGLWLFDHLAPVASGSPRPADENSTCHEGWTTLAAVAAMTTRVRVGLMVTAVPYRPVLVLAKMASTVDHVCGGRLDLGLGAGNTESEALQFGIPFGTPRERLDALEEACSVLSKVLRRDPGADAAVRLQPPTLQDRIPIVLGGKGERRTLPMVARYADGWNYSRGTPEEFSEKKTVLAQLCTREGRTIDEILCSVQVRMDHTAPNAALESAQRYVAAGANQIILYTQAIPQAVEVLATAATTLRRGDSVS